MYTKFFDIIPLFPRKLMTKSNRNLINYSLSINMKYCTYSIKGKRMKKLMVIMLFIGVFTQSCLAGYRDSALKDHCEQGIVNGKYRGGAYNPKVCLRAIKAVLKDKVYRSHQRYARAQKIAQKICRKHGRTSVASRKACQLEKYYWKKYMNDPSRFDRARW